MDKHAWDARYAGDELIWTAEPNRFLVSEVADLPPGRALDLACGEGRNAVWLATQGWQVTGADFSAVGLAKARRLADAHGVAIEWVQADAVEWDPPAGQFDLVVVMYLQLPEAQRRLAHRRAATGLAPGGTMLIVGHDLQNLSDGHGGPQDPAVLLTPDGVITDLAGLTIIRAEQVRRTIATDGPPVDAIDTLVRAVRAPGPG